MNFMPLRPVSDEIEVRLRDMNAARFGYEMAKQELKNLADELRGVDDMITDALTDPTEYGYIVEYIRERATKIAEASARFRMFSAECKEMGVD